MVLGTWGLFHVDEKGNLTQGHFLWEIAWILVMRGDPRHILPPLLGR
jgi:hypothetical protein